MEKTISLKQLRTDPRSYLQLLRQGYAVTITEHRRAIVTSVKSESTGEQGNVLSVLETLKTLDPIPTPNPSVDTVEMVKNAKLEVLEKKSGNG